MTDVFVIRNQQGHYWGKSKAWVDGSDSRAVLRTKHEDEAVNTLFELSAKDIELRGEVIAAELNERNNPVVEPSQIPLPVEPELQPEQEPAPPREGGETDTATSDDGAIEPEPQGAVESPDCEPKELV